MFPPAFLPPEEQQRRNVILSTFLALLCFGTGSAPLSPRGKSEVWAHVTEQTTPLNYCDVGQC